MIAALFFATGIVVLSLWLMNLLVAVITSSFQIIREESKRSAFQIEAPEEPTAEEETKSRVSGLKRLYDTTHVFWVVLIAFDLVVQSLRSASMGPTRRAFIMNSETVVTLLLLVEIILRFVCDWRGFIYSKRNWADLILA
ncbi:MAG: calcium channel protein, partial [Watsoniomyces obsoletus]